MTGALLATTLARARGSSDPWILLLIFGGIAIILAAVWWFERARKRAIVEGLRGRGFEVRETSRALDPADDAPLLGNPLLLFKRNKVRWSAMGAHNGNVVRLHEYSFTTGYGKSQQTHVLVFASAELPIGLPEFTIERKRWLTSHRPAIRGEPPPVQDARLAEFVCYAADASGAAAVLTPGVCEEIAAWDKKYMLRCAGGWVSVGRRGAGRISEIDDLLGRLDRVFNAIVAGLSAA
jgi:hypothetical protein